MLTLPPEYINIFLGALKFLFFYIKKDDTARTIVTTNPMPATIGKEPPPEIVVKIPDAVTPSKDNTHASTGPTNATSASHGSPKTKIRIARTVATPKAIKCGISLNPL